MRFGLSALPLGQTGLKLDSPSREVIERIAVTADELGFEFICAQDHSVAPRAWVEEGGGTSWFEPFTTLAYAAALTQRVKLLTDVVILPHRSPFSVAKIAATLDELSGGRLILGVAAGYLEEEFHVLQAPFEDRGDRTDEAIEVIKACWTNEWVTFKGTFFEATDVSVEPRPAQQPRPKIWVGGNSARALRRACEHADGWTPFRGKPERISEMLSKARTESLGDRSFDVSIPLRYDVYDGEALNVDGIRKQVDAYEAAGVTCLRVLFKGPTLRGYLDDMRRFADQII
ncbi:MAG: LLM class F420-dependent oxidoreductase [Actinomycetota bacterium]